MKKFGKRLQIYILAVLAAVVLSGCVEQEQKAEEPKTVTESIEETEEALAKSDNLNMPEIEVSHDFFSMKVTIQNEEEYQAFVDCLEEYTESVSLTLNLKETDTVIYLDDILAYQNFLFLTINKGGTISAMNMKILSESPVRDIELYHPYAIEENVLSQMPNLENITIRIDSQYNGALPAKELLQNTDCASIVVKWDDEGKEEVNLKELTEWDEINAMLSEDNCYLKALYVSNEDDYNCISYEFCVRGEERGNTCETNACAAFICIKDRESYGEKYFDILVVPVESIDTLAWLDGRRVRLEDVNFDGYRDLIFVGHNDPIGSLNRCIGFLWDEKEQRYEWNATVPKHIGRIDDERKRITFGSGYSAFDDDYYIYEYSDGVFTEKRLIVTVSQTEDKVTWQYYEDGELLKVLEETFDEDAKLYYITCEENGMVTEKVIEKNDYKYTNYSGLGKEYFPEFDFYNFG